MGLSGSCREPARPSSLHPSPSGTLSLRADGRPGTRHPLKPKMGVRWKI